MTHSGVIDVAADRQTATARWEIQEIARTRTVRSLTTTWLIITTGSCGRPSVRVLGAENPLADGCQVSELIPGRCQITRQARPSGEVATCG
jgi:hypothetical protein